jgi:hypothetical protein
MALANRALDALNSRNISGLRAAVFVASAVQALLPLGLIVFIARHANPMGDGMEWVGMVPALFIAALTAAPGLIASIANRWLLAGLLWAIAGALLNLAFYAEIVSEIGHLA